jgi:hypothetical protein
VHSVITKEINFCGYKVPSLFMLCPGRFPLPLNFHGVSFSGRSNFIQTVFLCVLCVVSNTRMHACSAHMHEIESARASTEQGVRLAMVVVHRADQMLGHVSAAADGTIQHLSQGLGPHHMGGAPPLSARGRRSSDLGARRPSHDDDSIRWEVDSVFPGTNSPSPSPQHPSCLFLSC